MTDNSIGLWGKGNTSPEKQTIQTYVCHISVIPFKIIHLLNGDYR